jgi:hypothetical protein
VKTEVNGGKEMELGGLVEKEYTQLINKNKQIIYLKTLFSCVFHLIFSNEL